MNDKPSWDDCPYWAEFLIRDNHGSWWWADSYYLNREDEPQQTEHDRWEPAVVRFQTSIERKL